MSLDRESNFLLKKQFYRLWFEFYKISLNSTDQKIKRNLMKTKDFYSSWDDVSNITFDQWWKIKQNLFYDDDVYLITDVLKKKYVDSIILEIPLNQSTTSLVSKIKKIINEEQKKRNKNHKNLKVVKSKYRPTNRVEPKFKNLKDVLNVYRDVYLPNQNLKSSQLLDLVKQYYLNRSKKDKLPQTLYFDNKNDEERVKSNLRRWIRWGKKITLNVSNGIFPGEY